MQVGNISLSKEEFHRCMLKIDDKLAVKYPNVFGRELHALVEFGTLFPSFSAALDKNNPIFQWYTAMYGEKLKGFGPWSGFIILIKGTVYKVNIPVMYGAEMFNPINLIEGITRLRLNSLTDDERKAIFENIVMLFSCIARIQNVDLLLWYGDLHTSISIIMGKHPHYGISKWASLQMVEKVIKRFLEDKRTKPPRSKSGHDLDALFLKACECGMKAPDKELVNAVKCTAGVRYGEIYVSVNEAVSAQHAAIQLCDHIAQTQGISRTMEISLKEFNKNDMVF